MKENKVGGLVRAMIVLVLIAIGKTALAQESPYLVTYDHHMEEPGNLEIETSATIGIPRTGQRAFVAPYAEFEYGVTGRWTTELYVEGQATAGSGGAFTGWRWENRVRPLQRERAINPVLYLEFEDVNEADKIGKEFPGHAPDLSSPNTALLPLRDRELEGKLILSSDTHDWNISENFIVEKNFSRSEGLEFGYSAGISRPLANLVSARECHRCREDFSAGLEIYGGAGSTQQFGFQDTAQYVAPVVSWSLAPTQTLRISPSFGLTHESAPLLFRVSYSYEIQGFRRKLEHLLGLGQ